MAIGALCTLFRMRRLFFFNGCAAEKLMHFCPPGILLFSSLICTITYFAPEYGATLSFDVT